MKQKIILLVVSLMMVTHSFAETIIGEVVGVTDGDTVTLLDSDQVQHKVRLAGIDAPEKKQAFGNVSKKALSDCAYSKTAHVETTKSDRYGRKVGKVTVDGVDCNLRQIKLGMAWHYKKYMNEQPSGDRQMYASAQIKAMVDHTGLWADVEAVPPWEFRKSR